MKVSLSLKLVAATALLLGSLSTAGFAASKNKAHGAKAGARLQMSCGILNRTEVALSGTTQIVNQLTPTDLNGSAVTFRVRGSTPACVIVNFTAVGTVPPASPQEQVNMIVRAVLDSTDTSLDGDIQLLTSKPNFFSDAHSYNFLFAGVPPGRHTVKMQVWIDSPIPGVNAQINDFNMQVRHN
jgi:hypothetical protein